MLSIKWKIIKDYQEPKGCPTHLGIARYPLSWQSLLFNAWDTHLTLKRLWRESIIYI